jgi:hypothetical protein
MDREDRIRVRAYDIWISEGCPKGREREHWEQAAAEIDGAATDGVQNTGENAEREQPAAAAEVTPETKSGVVRRVA